MLLAIGASAVLTVLAPSPLAALDSCFVVETTNGSVGTGFLIGGDRIVTASHVVDGESRVWLVTSAPEPRRLTGLVVLDDPSADIAVIEPQTEVAAHALTILPDAFPVGSTAFAIGSPIGGLVLSRGGVLGMRDGLIETNTPVDPGNSGGPLLDEQGRVRGVVIQKETHVGFALSVPASVLLTVLASPPPVPAPSTPLELQRGLNQFPWTLAFAILLGTALIALVFVIARRSGRMRSERIVIRFDEEL